jgi:hypothetical protein
MVFSGLPSKPVATVLSGLASKLVTMVSDSLASKPAAMVSAGLASKLVVTVFGGLASKPTATVFDGLASKPAVTIFRFGPQNRQMRFGDLASKSLRWFLCLGLKTNQATVYRLSHKTDGRAMAWDTRRDLAACFVWKQVGLGFPSLASRLAEARWWVVHVAPSRRLRQSKIKDKRIDAIGCIGSCYPYFVIFTLLCHMSIVVIYPFVWAYK